VDADPFIHFFLRRGAAFVVSVSRQENKGRHACAAAQGAQEMNGAPGSPGRAVSFNA